MIAEALSGIDGVRIGGLGERPARFGGEAPALAGVLEFFFTHALQTHHAGYGNHGAVVGTQALGRKEDVSAALAAGFNKTGSERLIGGYAARHHQLFDSCRNDGLDGFGSEHFGHGFRKRQSQIGAELGIGRIFGIVDSGQDGCF